MGIVSAGSVRSRSEGRTRAAADLDRRAGSNRSAARVGEPSRPMKQTVADWEVTIAMFDTGSDDSKARRLLRAAMPVNPPPPRTYVLDASSPRQGGEA